MKYLKQASKKKSICDGWYEKKLVGNCSKSESVLGTGGRQGLRLRRVLALVTWPSNSSDVQLVKLYGAGANESRAE